jgi:hypothetical protein
MGISTYRILGIIIAINLIMSIGIGIYENPTGIDLSIVDTSISITDQYASDIDDLDVNIRPDSIQEEGTVGSQTSMSLTILKLLARGMNPLPLGRETFDDPFDTILALGLGIIRGIMIIIIGVLIFDKFKNKKTD